MKVFQVASLIFLSSASAMSLRVLQDENVTVATDDINVNLTTALPTEPAAEGAGEGMNAVEPASEGMNTTEPAEGTNVTDGGFGSGFGEWAGGILNTTAETVSGVLDTLQNGTGFDSLQNDTGFNTWLDNVVNGGDNSTEDNVTEVAPTEDGPGMEGEESESDAEEGAEPATESTAAVHFASISALVVYAVSVFVTL